MPFWGASAFFCGEIMARNREFDDALDELKMLHDAKNHDYATAENPYKNLEEVTRIGIEPWRGVVIRLFDKFMRVEQFCKSGELAIKSEGLEDTFKDIAIYSTLAMILYRKHQDISYRDSLDMAQELTEIERGKDPENDEAEYWDKKIKDREQFSRKAVMKWRENGSIS